MKKLTAVFSFVLIVIGANAQYYYKDILSNRQLIKDMAVYKENKVRVINIKSIEGDGLESEGFFAQKKFTKDYKKTDLFSRSAISAASMQTSYFNNEGLLLQTSDSSDQSVTKNFYSYNSKGSISNILSSIKSTDDDFTNEIIEEHIYSYNSESGLPEKMQKVKNRKDTITILFASDDHGNISIEKDTKTGTRYYYYYDAKNRLTDIVQENDFKKSMRPDYVFEYNAAGLLTQMTASEEGINNYYVWKYVYDNGLRVIEKCFSKERRLMGTIEYEYK
ncbi:MAG TPA: hypothetical protein PK504_03885 [Ferruginibacter sp.]|nr:hypothetical protein [Ferruginibacter sp.]HRE63699.1 hypothetical protein [Ferruginibacter sp.]